MRLVVLLCGVIAGIVGLGFGWWGEPAALVDIYGLPTPLFAAAVLAIHVVSASSIAGGLLVLANPRVGGMMMLTSATIWLLIVALLGGGLGVSVAALIGIGAVGGLLAFLPSLSRPAYRLERAGDEPQRIQSESRSDFVEEIRPEAIAARFERARSAREASASEEPEAPPAEQASPYNWRGAIFDTSEDHSKPFEPTQWRFEEPDIGPVELDPEMQPSPPPPPPPREPELVADPQPWLSREDRSEHRAAYEIHRGRIRPLTLKAARRNRVRSRTLAGMTALAVLVVGLPTLLVVDYQLRVTTEVEPTSAEPEVAEATAPAPAPDTAPAADEAPRLPAGALAGATTDEPIVQPRNDKPSLPMPTPVAYQSPFDYCASTIDVDAPDLAVIAEGLPEELIAGVREVTGMPAADVLWRCMGQTVWVCAQPAGGAECSKVPTIADKQAFCAANPGAVDIRSAGGRWSCDGTAPVTPAGSQRPADPRGFDRAAWLGLSRAPVAEG